MANKAQKCFPLPIFRFDTTVCATFYRIQQCRRSATATLTIGFRQYSTRARSASCYLLQTNFFITISLHCPKNPPSDFPQIYRYHPGCEFISQARRLSYIITFQRKSLVFSYARQNATRCPPRPKLLILKHARGVHRAT